MKKMVRSCLNSYKDQRRKKQFQKQLGNKYKPLVSDCETIVVKNVGIEVYSKFHDMGGANNHGMLMHYSVKDSHPVAITKIENRSLAEREYRFLMWQKKYRDNTLSATPYGLTFNEDYACFITSILKHPGHFSYPKAEILFEQLGKQDELLSDLSVNGCKKDLAKEIDGSTKIKSILVNLVSSFDTESAKVFLENYLIERDFLFSNDKELYRNLQISMKKIHGYLKGCDISNYEGLVHGDFKRQNILEDSASYRVIDCQYYTYGIRLWDLAFLYSKDPAGFQAVEARIERYGSNEERAFLVFFYLISVLLNVKKKRSKKIMDLHVSPAYKYLVNLLESVE